MRVSVDSVDDPSKLVDTVVLADVNAGGSGSDGVPNVLCNVMHDNGVLFTDMCTFSVDDDGVCNLNLKAMRFRVPASSVFANRVPDSLRDRWVGRVVARCNGFEPVREADGNEDSGVCQMVPREDYEHDWIPDSSIRYLRVDALSFARDKNHLFLTCSEFPDENFVPAEEGASPSETPSLRWGQIDRVKDDDEVCVVTKTGFDGMVRHWGMALLQATFAGDMKRVRTCLKRGASLEVRDVRGLTPLHIAVEWGHEWLVKIFIEMKANTTVTGFDGGTLLHTAAGSSAFRVASKRSGAETTFNYICGLFPGFATKLDKNGNSALHLAASNGFLLAVEKLVQLDSSYLFGVNADGLTPLALSQIKGSAEVMFYLMQALMKEGLLVRYMDKHGALFGTESEARHEGDPSMVYDEVGVAFGGARDDRVGPGLLHHLGRGWGCRQSYLNPCVSGLVKLSHDGSPGLMSQGEVEYVLDEEPRDCCTNDVKGSWVCLDLGENYRIKPTGYTLRHGYSRRNGCLRHWELQGSFSCEDKWVTLRKHSNDASLNGPYDVKSWKIFGPKRSMAFQRFRLIMTGSNARGNHRLMVSGFELFGEFQRLCTPEIVGTTSLQGYLRRKWVDGNVGGCLGHRLTLVGAAKRVMARREFVKSRPACQVLQAMCRRLLKLSKKVRGGNDISRLRAIGAALRLQAYARGRLVRIWYHKLPGAVQVFSSFAAAALVRHEIVQEHAASLLQSRLRGSYIRNMFVTSQTPLVVRGKTREAVMDKLFGLQGSKRMLLLSVDVKEDPSGSSFIAQCRVILPKSAADDWRADRVGATIGHILIASCKRQRYLQMASLSTFIWYRLRASPIRASWLGLRGAAVLLQSCCRRISGRVRFRCILDALPRVVRTMRIMQGYVRATGFLQRYLQSKAAQVKVQGTILMVRRMQSYVRGRSARQWFLNSCGKSVVSTTAVVRLESSVRRMLCRRNMIPQLAALNIQRMVMMQMARLWYVEELERLPKECCRKFYPARCRECTERSLVKRGEKLKKEIARRAAAAKEKGDSSPRENLDRVPPLALPDSNQVEPSENGPGWNSEYSARMQELKVALQSLRELKSSSRRSPEPGRVTARKTARVSTAARSGMVPSAPNKPRPQGNRNNGRLRLRGSAR